MKKNSWNQNWYWTRFDDTQSPLPVTIPHDAMLTEPKSADAPGAVNNGWIEGRDYLYTKNFYVPSDFSSQTLLLEFEGVYHNAVVRLNNKTIASRPYGYSNFYADLGSHLKFDQTNHLEVLAYNSDQPNSRWYSGAGIYRPVTLWTAPKEYIPVNGIQIKTLSINPARISVSAAFKGNPKNITIEIWDGETVIASETKLPYKANEKILFELEIPDARLWCPEDPYLYTCKVSYGEDSSVETFGIRTLSYDNRGLCINGSRVILKGACIHHDQGLLGAACFYDAEERRIRILKENGYNAIRSAHNPCSKALLDVCDRMGMLVMDEFVDCWYIHKTKNDYVNYFNEWWQKDLESMVKKDYNHPSVILYSTGNEVSETAQKKGIELTGQMTEYLHQLDDTRPVSCGINIFFNFLSSIGFGVYSDQKADAESNGKKKKAVGSEFFNQLAGLFGDNFMKLGATLPFCDWKTKDAFSNMDIAGYNYGIFRYRHDLKKYPDRLILGSETFCKDAALFYQMAKDEPRIIGDFVWAGMDYLGEVAIGSWEYKDYAPDFTPGPGWVSAGSGRIDLIGTPLAEAAYTRVAFDLEPNPVIAVRPVNHTNDAHSPSAWKMTNAIESWSWDSCEGKDAFIEVYSSGESVSLYINDTKIGTHRLKHARTSFHAPYHSGEIHAVSYDKAGNELGRSSLYSAENETFLTVIPEKQAVRFDGLLYVKLQYTDCNGIIKPLERGHLSVHVTGGKLLATGNGCPFQKESFLTSETETYYGEAMAIIQATSPVIQIEVTDGKQTLTKEIPVKGEPDEHELFS